MLKPNCYKFQNVRTVIKESTLYITMKKVLKADNSADTVTSSFMKDTINSHFECQRQSSKL